MLGWLGYDCFLPNPFYPSCHLTLYSLNTDTIIKYRTDFARMTTASQDCALVAMQTNVDIAMTSQTRHMRP